MEANKFSDIIDTAIQREEEAYAFYMELHRRVKDEGVKDTLEFIAGEERKHRDFLKNYRAGKYGGAVLRMSDVVYYKIAEHLKEPDIKEDMRSEEVYLAAAHRELRSYKFYTEMAQLCPEGEVRGVLLRIANEELKHKEKMEYLYANAAFPQTAGG